MSRHGRRPLGVWFPSVSPDPGGCRDTLTFNLPGVRPAGGQPGHRIMNLRSEEGLPTSLPEAERDFAKGLKELFTVT